jgi:hypothetical protein
MCKVLKSNIAEKKLLADTNRIERHIERSSYIATGISRSSRVVSSIKTSYNSSTKVSGKR